MLAWRLDEHRVDTDVARHLRPLDRVGEPVHSQRIGARRHVQVLAVVACCPELGEPVIHRDDLLAGHVTAALRPHLILEEHPGRTGGLPQLHGADDVDRVAVSGVTVDDHE